MDKDLAGQVVDIARRVVASGAISANGHGNVSIRVPAAEEMYFTAGPSLRDHPVSAVVRVGLDGTLLEGDLPPIQGAVVAMHTAMYADHPEAAACCIPIRPTPRPTRWPGARSGAGWKRWPCSGCRTACRSPATGHAGQTRRLPTSGPPSPPGCQRCCWPTTAC